MNDQELFNKVASHLLKQGKRSTFRGEPRLYGENGNKCPLGCLIPAKVYDKALEYDESIPDYIAEEQWRRTLILAGLGVDNEALIKHLIYIHDDTNPDHWKAHLESCAEIFKLSAEVLDDA